jgi:hypothetical protein
MKASNLLIPYRGRVTYYDRINLGNIIGGLLLTIICSMAVGIPKNWAYSLIFIVLYFVFAALSIKLLKRKTNIFLR